MSDIKIAAFDGQDLEVISAHLQDAIVLIGDVNFNLKSGQFVLGANRFAWEEGDDRPMTQKTQSGIRKRTGVLFSKVTAAKSQNIKQGAGDAVLSLLALEFEADQEAPAGIIKLVFSGGGVIELNVECVEVQLEDLGPRWETGNVPEHDQE